MREQDFISEARQATRDIWNAYNKLRGLQIEWNALDYGNTLDPGVGENEGLTAVQIGAVVFDTADAMKTAIFDTGHSTNLARLL